ncbi:hypothetical protein ACFL21_03465 [Patescibacteria group bacterium]
MARKGPNTQAISMDELKELQAHPAFNVAVDLLGSDLVLTDGQNESHSLPIHEVEPYEGLTQKQYIKGYQAVKRDVRETFLAWSRGKPSLNVIVEHSDDPEDISVVHIRQVEIDGKRESISKAVTDILGIKRSDFAKGSEGFADFRPLVARSLDEQEIDDSRSKLRVVPRKVQGGREIRRVSGAGNVNNSLGRFVKVENGN